MSEPILDSKHTELMQSVRNKIEKGYKSQRCYVCGRRLDQTGTGYDLYHCWWCGVEYVEKFNDLGDSLGFWVLDETNEQRALSAVGDIDLDTKLLRSKFVKENGKVYRIDRPSGSIESVL